MRGQRCRNERIGGRYCFVVFSWTIVIFTYRVSFLFCHQVVTGSREVVADPSPEIGRCIWYNECGKDPATKKPLNCVYDKPAPPMTDEDGLELLQELCPQFVDASTTSKLVETTNALVEGGGGNPELSVQFYCLSHSGSAKPMWWTFEFGQCLSQNLIPAASALPAGDPLTARSWWELSAVFSECIGAGDGREKFQSPF